jgi:hypothetical protein
MKSEVVSKRRLQLLWNLNINVIGWDEYERKKETEKYGKISGEGRHKRDIS